MRTKYTSLAFLLFALALCSSQVQAQYITTFAGNGQGNGTATGGRSGDGGEAIYAELFSPSGVMNYSYIYVYITDQANHVVRRVNHEGIISTFAGNDQVGFTFGGDTTMATDSKLSNPYGVVVDSVQNVFFSDYTNNVVYKVDTAGVMSVVAGNDTAGYKGDGEMATDARLNHPLGIALDRDNNLYIADALNNVIRRVDALTGIITTVAGSGYGAGLLAGHGDYKGDNGLAIAARLNYPSGIAVDKYNNLYIADAYNNVIRKVSSSSQNISTFAGIRVGGYEGDGGPANAAGLLFPAGVAVDGPGNVYIADQGNNNIRKVTTDGKITTIAGNHAQGYNPENHIATTTQLDAPTAIAVTGDGLVYIADRGNNVVRLVGPPQIINSVKSVNNIEGELKLYPNPSTGSFTVAIPALNGTATIAVTDMIGKTVTTKTTTGTNAQNVSFDLAGIPSGNYIVKISAAGNTYRQKLQLTAL